METQKKLQIDFRKIVAAQVMNIDGVYFVLLDGRWIECARGENIMLLDQDLSVVMIDEQLYCLQYGQYQPMSGLTFGFNDDKSLLYYKGAIYQRQEFGFNQPDVEPWLEGENTNYLKVYRSGGKIEAISYDGRAIVFLGELIEEVTPTVAKIKSQGIEMFCQLAPKFQVLDKSNRIVRFETSGENNGWLRLFMSGSSSVFVREFCANLHGQYIYLP